MESKRRATKAKSATNARKKLKTTSFMVLPEEKRLNDKIEALIPESQAFNKMVEFEKLLDAQLQTRKLDVQDALKGRQTRGNAMLRINIFNTYQNQGGTYNLDNQTMQDLENPPSWTLRIEGSLVSEPQGARYPPRKFSSFLKKIFIQLDKTLYPENNIIEWSKTTSVECDGFEIKRKGDKDIPCKIIVHLDQQPSQFKLSPALSNLLNIHTDTRSRIITALWQYIKSHKLQDPQDRRTIINNPPLKAVFGVDKMQFNLIPQLLGQHLSHPDPFEFDYTIRVSGQQNEIERAYDVPVTVEEPLLLNQVFDFLNKQVASYDDQIVKLIEQINLHKRKRDFMVAFVKDPVNFIHNLVSSQIHDHRVLNSQTARDEEQERHAKYYFQPHVIDAVTQYVNGLIAPQEK
mmetsp:Transcript_13173/g.18105  ORF Transcript_13173/g.18105 Transcript_13173/m.18105 type:complete len:404 (-) Transcript_13173:13-1224(-)